MRERNGMQGKGGMVIPRTIVLIGLMGAGKSCIGRRLAARRHLPFHDADAEIEAAAGCSVSDIFTLYGEAAFRDGERKVIARLLAGPVHILAAGGGAYMDLETRQRIHEKAISIWLRADLDVLVKRTAGRSHRPLLRQGSPREVLQKLIEQRYPVYQEADIVVESRDEAVERTVDQVIAALRRHLEGGLGESA